MEYCSILTSLGDYLLPAAGAPCPLPYFADAPNLFFDNLQRRRTRSRFCARNGKRNTKISQCPTRALLGAELCACVRHPAQIRRSLAHKRSRENEKIASECQLPTIGARCPVFGARFSVLGSQCTGQESAGGWQTDSHLAFLLAVGGACVLRTGYWLARSESEKKAKKNGFRALR